MAELRATRADDIIMKASEMISRIQGSGTVNQVRWHELSKQPDFKTKGDKRNGTMSRQQAFGGLFRKGGE